MEEILKHRCSRCQELKPKTQFCKNKSTSLGHDYICKACKYADAKIFREKKRMEKEQAMGSEIITEIQAPIEKQGIDGTMFDAGYHQLVERHVEENEAVEQPICEKDMRLTIYFKDYPELFDYILTTAKESFRTNEMTVLFMIDYHKKDWTDTTTAGQ